MAEAKRSIEINAPVEKVFAVISDYDRYAEFLPEVKRISTSGRRANQVDVHYEVNVVKTIHYTLRMSEQKPNRVDWTFVEGELMKDNRGSWVLERLGEGRTKATYTIEVKLGALVPGAIVKALVETNLPKMLEAFKFRSESA